MPDSLDSIGEAVYLFKKLEIAEANYFYNHFGKNIYKDDSQVVKLIKCYPELAEEWLSHPSVKWIKKQHHFIEATKLLRKKDITCMLRCHPSAQDLLYMDGFFRNRHGAPEKKYYDMAQSTPSPYSSETFPPLLIESILAAITLQALQSYKGAHENGSKGFIRPSLQGIEKISSCASKLLLAIEAEPYLDEKLSKAVRKEIEKLANLDIDNASYQLSHYNYLDHNIKRNHPKVEREIFIRHLSKLYFSKISAVRKCKGNAGDNPHLFTKPVFSRQFLNTENSNIDVLLERVPFAERLIHADVIAELTAIIDPDITERRASGIIKKLKEDLLETSREPLQILINDT